MVSCLILYHTTITGWTKVMVLRSVFTEEDFQIEVIGEQTVIIYLWNVEKKDIWQAVLLLEMEQIDVGYGFGKVMEDAKNEAIKKLIHPQRYQQIKALDINY